MVFESKTTYYRPSIHNVHHSNLSETVWYPPDLSEPSNLSDHPELRESRLDHPELSASPIFEGGHLPVEEESYATEIGKVIKDTVKKYN